MDKYKYKYDYTGRLSGPQPAHRASTIVTSQRSYSSTTTVPGTLYLCVDKNTQQYSSRTTGYINNRKTHGANQGAIIVTDGIHSKICLTIACMIIPCEGAAQTAVLQLYAICYILV